jgi:hypothetical protein
MLYNSCTGIYKFGNNTYPRSIRRRSNLGHIFSEGGKSYGPGNTVDENCPLVGYYAASSGNSLQTFRERHIGLTDGLSQKKSVKFCHYSLLNKSEERRTRGKSSFIKI